MASLMKTIFFFTVVVTVVGLSQAAANPLSDAFYKAFTNPEGFDAYLQSERLRHDGYLEALERCYLKAIGLLTIIERRENRRYSSCYYNNECYKMAKKLQAIKELRLNIEELYTYVKNAIKNNRMGFSDSSIGKAAFITYNFHRKNYIDIRTDPVFRSQLSILSSIDGR